MIKDHGPCFGTNEHLRKDTDVILRLSKSTIEDLSFYIGFIKIQSSNEHVRPCYVMNGHFCRDPHDIKTARYYNSFPISFYRF